MISIINYGLGNLGSIVNMFNYLNISSEVIHEPKQLKTATKILLPGVGAFDAGMINLKEKGWIEALNEAVTKRKVPTAGICLGMQLMTDGSEEGKLPGLGWIKGYTKKFLFPSESRLKVPHMGWTDVELFKNTPLFPQPVEENRFYFVHSFFVELAHEGDIMLRSDYGGLFTSGFNRENIYGMQFHPEKSHKFGKRLLQRFADL